MAITGEDNIVLKLGIKGVDPAEARAIAMQGAAGLESAFQESLQRQSQLYKVQAETMDANAKAYAAKELSQAQSQATALQSLLKQAYTQQERDAKEHAAHMAEVKEHSGVVGGLTSIGEGIESHQAAILGAASIGFIAVEAVHALFELGESIAHVSAVTEGFTGNIAELREVTNGEISDMDLMTASNAAVAKNLSLTSEQFGIISNSALHFAAITGGSVKESLDDMINGLATGRSRALSMSGVVLDQEKIFADYAESIGHAGATLDQHAKSVALSKAAMEAMDIALVNNTGHVSESEVAVNKLKASWDNFFKDAKLGIADFVMDSHSFDDAIGLVNAKMKDAALDLKHALGGAPNNEHYVMQYWAQLGKEKEEREKLGGGAEEKDAALARLASAGAAYAPENGEKGGVEASKKPYKPTGMERLFNALSGGMGLDPAEDGAIVTTEAEKRAIKLHDLWNQGLLDVFGKPENYTDAELAGIYSGNAEKTGKNSPLMLMLKSAGWSDEDIAKGAEDTAEAVVKELDDKLTAAMEKMDKQTRANKKAAGPMVSGIMEKFFGPDIMDTARDKMTELQGIVYDASKTMEDDVTKAGNAMAAGFGKAVAATIIHGTSLKAGLQNETEAVLESLSSQALGQSLMYAAKALGWGADALFTGDPKAAAAAAEAGVAAAAFGAVGVSAGVLARAVGTTSTSASSSPGGTPTTTGAGYGSPTQGNNGNLGNTNAVVINLSVMPGGESAAGESITKALAAYQAQTGQTLDQMLRN